MVLEASWNNSKAMFKQIQEGLLARGSPPLRTVALQGLKGTYWKFHNEGSSAVSTIEAVVHFLRELQGVSLSLSQSQRGGAGGPTAPEPEPESMPSYGKTNKSDFSSLLWPFEYDRARLFRRIESGVGKVPRTVAVEGTGIGSWRPYLAGQSLSRQVGGLREDLGELEE